MSPLTAERCSAAPPQRGELSVPWKNAGMQNVRFIDAMSEDIPDDMRKSFLEYPWIKDKFKRRYMMGCLNAFAKTTVTMKSYDLERLRYKGGLRAEVDLGFDQSQLNRARRGPWVLHGWMRFLRSALNATRARG